MRVLLSVVFFLSGASALIFETLWFRQAGLAFGNSLWASSLVLSGFMGGLAIGNAAAARFGDRVSSPVRAYALAEIAIAITGVALVYVFPALGVALAPVFRPLLDHAWIVNPLRLVIAFALLLIPSTAMGLTLPLLTNALTQRDIDFGRVLGGLYGWNTLGGMLGVVAGEMYLVGSVGVRGTALVAGGLNIISAVVAALLTSRTVSFRPGGRLVADPGRTGTTFQSGGRRLLHPAIAPWLAVSFLSGFCLLALEVIWFRFLVLFVKGHSNAFPLMLAVVLGGIAVGGLGAAIWLRRNESADRSVSAVTFATGLICVVSYATFPRVLAPLALSTITRAPEILRIGVPLMFPVSCLSGVLFTFTGTALRRRLSSQTGTTGLLTLANTTGAAIGSLAAGFVFLPVLGLESSIFAVAVIYGLIGGIAAASTRTVGVETNVNGSKKTRRSDASERRSRPVGAAPRRRFQPAAIVSGAALVFGLVLFPFGVLNNRLIPIPVARWAPDEALRRIVAVRQGLTETVIYFERLVAGKPVSDVMLTNSFSMSTTGYGVRRYQKLYVYWPTAIHAHLRSALLIGFGVGNTAKAMTDSPGLETIDIADLSRDILAMSSIVFPDPASHPLRDPRVHVHIEDGRYFLQTTGRRFDLITGEPPPPGIAGVEPLYTREYFQLIYDRLSDGGVVTYWLPLADLSDTSAKAILRAFCDAFDDCSLWNASGTNLMMVATRNARGPVDDAQFVRQWRTPAIAAEMKRLGFEQPEQLGALFIGDADYVRDLTASSPAFADDGPKLIEAAPSSPDADRRMYAAFTDVSAARDRFRKSAFIRKLWPERMVAASIPYFDFQDVINAHMYGDLMPPRLAIEDVHRVLTQSSLTAPVLWRLASNADIQQTLSTASADELRNPVLQFHLGIRLLSERDYQEAAESFNRATQSPQIRDNAFVLYIYALCMSGQRAKAQQISSEAFAASGATSLPPVWVWMRETFGLDPGRQVEK